MYIYIYIDIYTIFLPFTSFTISWELRSWGQRAPQSGSASVVGKNHGEIPGIMIAFHYAG